jgi:hypothetical protein
MLSQYLGNQLTGGGEVTLMHDPPPRRFPVLISEMTPGP